ncbi:MAG: alanine--tRNA ligase [Oligoflexales bacterium]
MSREHPYGLEPLSSEQVRQSFLDFFQARQHSFVRSSSVAPTDDPTLLFTNAGMNQFKSIFLGDQSRGLKRATNSQKVLRVSGKHNDLDEVGLDGTHHTFFEMLGTWSFGDYYKKEAISWAWELLTVVWKLPKDRLFATVYEDDQEAYDLWLELTDIQPKNVMKFGKKENFWEMGQVGPCGPCSEIHFDTGDVSTREQTYSDLVEGVNGENTRYVEIWNLVFMQYQRLKSGDLEALSATHVDTGAGLERICAILQGVSSNYETDLLKPLIHEVVERSGHAYNPSDEGMAHRVVVDHLRAVSFAIADGVTPGNEGRGYVVRRILRRAIRYAHQLGQKQPFIYLLVPALVSKMGDAYPELRERENYIAQVIESEERRFLKTLETGLNRLESLVVALKEKKKSEVAGADAFLFHDTYGFPRDLTRLIAAEHGLGIDEDGFDAAMAEQKDRARKASRFDASLGSDESWNVINSSKSTGFVGYESLIVDEAAALRYREEGDYLDLVVDKTSFYAEAGGQIGDHGVITGQDLELKVVDTFRVFDMHVHRCSLVKGLVQDSSLKSLSMKVDEESRLKTRRNHSATHLLHEALRETLGQHVAQQGSYVGPDRLRFDFTHHQGLSVEEIKAVELRVNEMIHQNSSVQTEVMCFDEAKNSGATALFGEKYGDTVRVLTMGPSRELCGGTHALATGEIGYFKVVAESSIASGVRRLEALTGISAVICGREDADIVQTLARSLKVSSQGVCEKVESVVKTARQTEKELNALRENQLLLDLQKQLDSQRVVCEGHQSYSIVELDSKKFSKQSLSRINQDLAARLDQEIVVMICADNSDLMIFAAVGARVREKLGAGTLMKQLAQAAEGKGGGRPDRAQAGSKRPDLAAAVRKSAETLIEQVLKV